MSRLLNFLNFRVSAFRVLLAVATVSMALAIACPDAEAAPRRRIVAPRDASYVLLQQACFDWHNGRQYVEIVASFATVHEVSPAVTLALRNVQAQAAFLDYLERGAFCSPPWPLRAMYGPLASERLLSDLRLLIVYGQALEAAGFA